MSLRAPTVLVRNAEVAGRRGADVRVGRERIEEVGAHLGRHPGEQVIDAAGGAVIPGLHDHHLHLRAAAAAQRSLDASQAATPASFDQLIAAATGVGAGAGSPAAGRTTAGRWLRVTGWDEHRAGPLDRRRLDLLTGQVPVRVQHRSGAMWVLNSAGLRAVGAERCELDGVERDQDRTPTGRLLRLDGWLRDRLTAAGAGPDGTTVAGLAAYASWCARLGVTGFTDATPWRDRDDADELAALSLTGRIPQRLMLMAPADLRLDAAGRVAAGPVKVLLDDDTLPGAANLAADIGRAHSHGRSVAVHCVTAEQLVVAVAAFAEAGSPLATTADRIEHAGIVPPGYAERIAQLGLAVVTQPGFVSHRGDAYLQHVPVAERQWLYPCASLLRAGVAVGAGSDAPFGPASPWLAMAAAVSRRTLSGAILGAGERISPARALRLYLADPADIRRTRTVTAGQPGDVCVLGAPLRVALSDLAATTVAATITAGQMRTHS